MCVCVTRVREVRARIWHRRWQRQGVRSQWGLPVIAVTAGEPSTCADTHRIYKANTTSSHGAQAVRENGRIALQWSGLGNELNTMRKATNQYKGVGGCFEISRKYACRND